MSDEQNTSGQPKPGCDCFCGGIGPDVTNRIRQKSGDARQHFQNARLEILKAVRSLIDDRIDYLSQPQQKGTSIPVD